MRQYAIAFCGFALLVICGARVLRAGVTYAVRSPDLGSAPLNLPLPLAHGGAGHEGAGEGGGAARGGWQHFVSWVGHFHPALTVFPIAMILSAALAELLRLWTKAPWLDGAFPTVTRFSEDVPDAVLDRGLLPAFGSIEWLLAHARVVQRGPTQVYLLYVLGILILLLLLA